VAIESLNDTESDPQNEKNPMLKVQWGARERRSPASSL